MFQKPAFGTSNTSTFGSFNAGSSAASPFGGFKAATATSAFGAPPAFGAAAAPQPTAGPGLFGSSTAAGGLFGNTAASTSAPAFGASSGAFGGFGASTSANTLFNNSSGGGLFGAAQNTQAFGAKPAGFGFGASPAPAAAAGGLFGAAPAPASSLFPSAQANNMSGGGLFNNTSAFGQQQTQSGTGHTKYNPVVGTDVIVKSGTSQNINIKHHCITCMKEYENKSLEELRLEDYAAGRKGAQAGGMFGGFAQPQQENKPLFGGSTFGQPAATTASSVFGGTHQGFLSSGGTFSFGNAQPAQTSTTSLFGAPKPAFGAPSTTVGGLFGATTTQAPAFGTNTSSFGFSGTTQNQPTGLFGAKPATSSFGGAAPAAGFGGFGGAGGLFQTKPQQPAPAFGTQAPAFGALSSSFGTAPAASGGLFAGAAFGKPAAQPTVGFNTQPQPGLGGLGANAFQAKPGAAPFGTLGGGSIFNQQQPTNNFLSKPDGGLGGMFGNSFGAPSLGMGMNNSTQLTNNTLSGSSATGNVHEQILTLAARPYGDSPLFKHLLPENSTTAEDVLKPTNPAAVKAILDSSAAAGYRVTSPGARLRLQPRPNAQDKKSLFDGLEESDASLEDKLSLKPSRKRLVLRPNQRNDSLVEEQSRGNNRSVEEQSIPSPPAPRPPPASDEPDAAAGERRGKRGGKRSGDFDYNVDVTADKSNYWSDQAGGGSPTFPAQWSDKEKPIDGEPTPRLAILDKEVNTQTSERRASWLTTIALRKPPAPAPPADSAEHSVRELAVRAHSQLSDKENRDSRPSYTDTTRDGSRISNDTTRDGSRISNGHHTNHSNGSPEGLQFCSHRGGVQLNCSCCEKIQHQIQGVYVSEEENVPPRLLPPHPTGVKLTRPGYYTIPTLDEMIAYMRPDGSCIVPHLTIGRQNYGNVFYDCEIDVAGLDIDALVHFLNKEVIIYPEDADKPPVGQGLNRRAIVTLDRVWPRDKTQKRAITDPARLIKMEYESKLRRVCDKHDTKFIEYRPQTGSWVFRVEHFSKYGLTDSDEEDEGPTPDVLKRQLVKEAVQKSAAPPAPKPIALPSPGLGGLGGLGLSSSIGGGLTGGLVSLGGGPGASEDSLLAMHQTSLNLLNGAGKAFEMDTTEDNAESQSLYQDNRAFGVKSPTSELARLENRQSHHLQLMKASLYADTEMEDDISISTGDQLVPISTIALPTRAPSAVLSEHEQAMDDTPPAETDEVQMASLTVPPHTVVLKYHRKVPPYSKTIAGRLGASYLADMSVARARHSRVGFGPRATIAYVTSANSIADLPKNGELCDLGKYVRGRAADDWSEAVVARLAVAQGDNTTYLQEALSRHLETLLEYSDLVSLGEGQCPMLKVKQDPKQRRELLNKQLRDAQARHDTGVQFGVSSKYCYEVWKLCDALWGADLDNDGVPGNDVASIVHRHRRLLDWMKDAVAEVTDDELSKPSGGEEEDKEDGHSSLVWTLLLGGRALEACRVAREHGDLHMAALVAQAAGPPAFRNLVSRQLSLWRECGAEPLIASRRAAALRLAAGQAKPLDKLLEVDWLRALHATQRYLCPQVPTLEHVIRTYEGFFSREETDDEVDLTTVEADEMGLKLPVPPYAANENVMETGNQRRVLDLRYELIRARALNTRPKLRPAAYTADPLDYSLAFLLGTWCGNPTVESITGFAEQLTACGLWHLAVQALAYHPDHAARGHLIRAVLSRHAPAQADTPDLSSRLELVERLQLPTHWLQLAMAHRAKYENLPRIEAEHLAGAGQWNAAHKVLLEQLLPEVVLADDLESIAPLLEKMNEAASRHLLSGWERGGQALYHYLHVCMEIRGLVSGAEADEGSGNVPARLEALRPRVAAACRALKQLSTTTPRLAAARSEMGARLVQLALAGGEPAHHLAALLRALQLPPDCTAAASHKITTELAERASDSCAASVDSSPLSHRTALLS